MLPINNIQEMFMRSQQMLQIQQILQMQQQQMINSTPNHNDMEEDEEEEDDEVIRSLFCANLDERVDEEVLYELFLQAGPLENVRLPKQRNFAFITYVHTISPAYAMNLFQGVSLYGKSLVLKYQGKTTIPPLPHRVLPPNWGMADRSAPQNGWNVNDSSALRVPHFNPFAADISMPMVGPEDNNRNNNRNQLPTGYSSLRNRDDGRDLNRRDRLGRERLHNNSSPYERRRDSSRDRNRERDREHDRDRDRHFDERRNRSHRRL